MATDEELLLRFMPKVCYDSLEAFFADHPLRMLVNPRNTLRREHKGGRDGERLATAPNIELDWPNSTRRLSTHHARFFEPTRCLAPRVEPTRG